MRQVDTRFSNRIWTVRIGASALRVSEMQSCILSCRPATATLACHASLPARTLGCCWLCVSYIIARCVLSDDPRVSALTMSAGLAAVLPDLPHAFTHLLLHEALRLVLLLFVGLRP